MYSVLNTLSEYICFYISKMLLHTLSFLVIKIVKSRQCILNFSRYYSLSTTTKTILYRMFFREFSKFSEPLLLRTNYRSFFWKENKEEETSSFLPKNLYSGVLRFRLICENLRKGLNSFAFTVEFITTDLLGCY